MAGSDSWNWVSCAENLKNAYPPQNHHPFSGDMLESYHKSQVNLINLKGNSIGQFNPMLVSGRVCHWKTGGEWWFSRWRLFSPLSFFLHFWSRFFLKTTQNVSNSAKSPKPERKMFGISYEWPELAEETFCSCFVFLETHLFTIETHLVTKNFLAPKSFQTCHAFFVSWGWISLSIPYAPSWQVWDYESFFFLSGTTNEQWQNLVV